MGIIANLLNGKKTNAFDLDYFDDVNNQKVFYPTIRSLEDVGNALVLRVINTITTSLYARGFVVRFAAAELDKDFEAYAKHFQLEKKLT